MKTCLLLYHWKLDICNYEAFIKHKIVSIVKVVPTKMLSSFWGGAIAPAVPIAFPSVSVGEHLEPIGGEGAPRASREGGLRAHREGGRQEPLEGGHQEPIA